jgi:Zn-dependent protease
MHISPDIIFEIVAFLFAISVHESAHAWTASYFGDQTARMLGRITLNPLKHIDPIGTVLFPLIGAITGAPIFGWAKPTPVNVRELGHPRRDHMLVAAAGPASNFLIAIVALGLLLIAQRVIPAGFGPSGGPEEASILTGVVSLLFAFMVINLILGVFNLIPIPPLDGSGILYGFLRGRAAMLYMQVGRFGFVLLILLLYSGIVNALFSPVLGLFLLLLRF